MCTVVLISERTINRINNKISRLRSVGEPILSENVGGTLKRFANSREGARSNPLKCK